MYQGKDEKDLNRNSTSLSVKVNQPTLATVQDPLPPKAQAPPGPHLNCGQEDHWDRIFPNLCRPPGPCSKCYKEGHWTVDCPHIPRGIGRSHPDHPSDNLLGLPMDNQNGPRSFCFTNVISNREPLVVIMISGRSISLNTGATYIVMMECRGPTSPSCFPIVE